MFKDNVYWNFPDTIFRYKYQYLNGFKANIPVEMYNFLEKQKQVKYIYNNSKNNYSAADEDWLSWGVDRIEAEKVWGGSENAKDVISGYPAGEGVKICIIGSGIDYYHSDLNDNYKGGYDFAPINRTGNGDNDPYPDHTFGDNYKHETWVAGFLAPEDNEADLIAVTPEISLYAVKILGIEWINDEYVEYQVGFDLGVEWAIANDMDIINISWGGTGYVEALDEACQKAYEKGITIVASAGNEESTTRRYPCSYSSVIQVGATNWASDHITNYSNYNTYQEFVAPGGTQAVPLKTTDFDGGTVLVMGTSFASPLVAGTCALMHEVAPNIMPEEIRYVLRETAIDKGDSGWDQEYGWGLIQTESAVVCLTDSTDSDSDGLINIIETDVWGTDPYDSDSDNDGLNDTAEVRIYHSNPMSNDTDSDSISDYDEVTEHSTDPIDEDSDNDGYHDQIEIILGYNPLNVLHHPSQAFLIEYGDGDDYTWTATDSPYNEVDENETLVGNYYSIRNREDSSHLYANMFAEYSALDLSDWDGTNDLVLTFICRSTSGYSSGSVTQFRVEFYDDDTSTYINFTNPTSYDTYFVKQSDRNGQIWINGDDSDWQNVTFSLLASEFEDYAETDDVLYFHWGHRDMWSTFWNQTEYLDFVTITEDDNMVVPNQPRNLLGLGDGVSSISLVWLSPLNILADEYIIERKVSGVYTEQDTVEQNGFINASQYWTDSDTLSTGVTYYYRICAVNEEIEGAYAYWSGKVDGFSNPIDVISSFDTNSLSQNSFNILIVISIFSLIGISQIILRFRQSFVS
ncbi:MAG: S8 family serine peptidase [Candidatus Heimdallarchaeota archaeon]